MADRPLLLDCFCKAGGAAVGYARAGFDVVGGDHAPQPRYPFPMIVADALRFLRSLVESEALVSGQGYGARDGEGAGGSYGYLLSDFAAIHASPPCQAYSRARHTPGAAGRSYPDLLAATRQALVASGRPWVIENVELAPMRGIVICGTALGLRVRRHRVFESSHLLLAPGPCRHRPGDLGVYAGKVTRLGTRAAAYAAGSGRTHYRPRLAPLREGEAAMGIDWMTREELAQAVPPAYTFHLGLQLRRIIAP